MEIHRDIESGTSIGAYSISRMDKVNEPPVNLFDRENFIYTMVLFLPPPFSFFFQKVVFQIITLRVRSSPVDL